MKNEREILNDMRGDFDVFDCGCCGNRHLSEMEMLSCCPNWRTAPNNENDVYTVYEHMEIK